MRSVHETGKGAMMQPAKDERNDIQEGEDGEETTIVASGPHDAAMKASRRENSSIPGKRSEFPPLGWKDHNKDPQAIPFMLGRVDGRQNDACRCR